MEQVTTSVQSTAQSLNDLIKLGYRFSVPRYQRLYVWEDEQVSTLVADLLTASETPRQPYFLGGILVVRNKHQQELLDLIDGQQRLTTLWLMSVALEQELADFTTCNGQPRLVFSIRATANAYFRTKAGLDTDTTPNPEQPADFGLERITRAYERVRGLLEQAFGQKKQPELARQRFSEFLRSQVHMVVTEVPPSYDLNRLFEAINNRGAQLQHHEILKSRILSCIADKSTRRRYALLWNACSNMNSYVEHNTNQELRQNTADWYDRNTFSFDLKGLLKTLNPASTRSNTLKLNQILAGKTNTADTTAPSNGIIGKHPERTEDEDESVRSILSFPQLLLHVLRIFLFQRKLPDLQRINEKELLKLFSESNAVRDARTATAFIYLLWQVRFCFDLFVIKWVQTSDEERHAIKPLVKEKQYYQRTNYLRRRPSEGGSSLELLQSMLYHSQQITTHYWLTPFLYQALNCRDKSQLDSYLRKLDNHLFCTDSVDNLAKRTWSLMGSDLDNSQQTCSSDELDRAKGVGFPHYWFYKLDFVLWHHLKTKKEDKRWQTFRFTAKNSVEHVSPQTPRQEDSNVVPADLLNDFGNLALVSRSINSEASNKPFVVKQKEFSIKQKFDSLKSALIYENEKWNEALCDAHREEMKAHMQSYFAECSN
jgi:hypothetical protein